MKKIFSALAIVAMCLVFSNNSIAQSASHNADSTILKVTNLTCNGDMPTIKKQLLNQDGIIDVSYTPRVNNGATFTVKYLKEVTDRKGIVTIVETTPGCDDKSSTPYKVKKEKQ